MEKSHRCVSVYTCTCVLRESMPHSYGYILESIPALWTNLILDDLIHNCPAGSRAACCGDVVSMTLGRGVPELGGPEVHAVMGTV